MQNDEPGTGQNQNSGDDYFDLDGVTDTNSMGPEMEAAAHEARKVVLNLQHRATEADIDRTEIYLEASLVKRARALVKSGPMAIKYIHFKKGNPNDMQDIGPRAKPDSLMNRHAVYDALFDHGSGLVPYPHYDTFKGRLVDHQGNTFSARTLRTRELVQALDAAGMENPTDKEVADSLRSWALDHQRDSLLDYFTKKLPEWDGESRLETLLIDLFKPFDTELTRLVGKYFWLSLYNRITAPGALAPISIALIGGQDAGKSYFSLMLCRLLIGDQSATAIQLDLGAKNYNNFLRAITGKSIVANVGEMTGFNKGDMERIKSFVAKTEDDLDFKFEDSIVKPRQWITIMDGNGYAGLQRDDTGNRRFYPLFVFQEPDVNGQPSWMEGQKIDFSMLKENIWQVMAECQVWMEENGHQGYIELVGAANRGVQAFSLGEMKKARGVVKDDNIEINLKGVLLRCSYRRMGANAKQQGFFVASEDINRIFLERTRREPFSRTLAPHMRALGFEPKQIGRRGYLIEDVTLGSSSEQDMLRMIWRHGVDDSEGFTDAEVDAEIAAIVQGDGGNF